MAGRAGGALLHEHSDCAPLAALLAAFLPLSLPLYATLAAPGLPTPVYASFPPGSVPEKDAADDEPFLILADLGNQLRFFCSAEWPLKQPGDEHYRQKAERLVGAGLEQYLRDHARISVGAIPDIWRPIVRDTFGVEPFSNSEIHYRTLTDLPAALPNGSTKGASLLPGGVLTTAGRPEDISEILSTSEVPHPPAYIETRLDHTTVLRSTPQSSDAAESPPPASSPPPDQTGNSPAAPPPGSILAHCTTHRDGSIGTLHVSPLARRRGLGTQVYLARAHAMRDRDGAEYVFSYVHRENGESNALMRRVGMRKSAYEVWWARVKLPLAAAAGSSSSGSEAAVAPGA
ncbi:hypothetical protein JCM8202v2_004754 [Rhodotorula sphaerocarpa]